MVVMPAPVTLQGELLASLWIAVPIGLVFGAGEWLYRRRGLEGEITRKIAHAAAGVVVMSMPWVAGTHWTVLVLSAGFAAILGGTRLLGWLPSVHAVSRQTGGAWYYPMAVYLTFVLSRGDPLLYCVPMMVMAFGDAGAAVVGRRYGIVRYRVIEDFRSLGGSLTFFGLTFAVVLCGVGLSGRVDLPSALVITLLVSMVATAVEGISVRGADNLLVPYATFIVLHAALGRGRDGLGDWVLASAAILTVLLLSFRQTRLNATAFMALFVGWVLAFGLGGPMWLLTAVVPYVAFAAGRPGHGAAEADLEVMVPTFAVSLVIVLARGHTGTPALFVPFLVSIAAVTAIVLAAALPWRWLGLGGGLLALAPALALGAPVPLGGLGAAATLSGAGIALLLSGRLQQRRVRPAVSWVASVAGGTSSALIWVVGHGLF